MTVSVKTVVLSLINDSRVIAGVVGNDTITNKLHAQLTLAKVLIFADVLEEDINDDLLDELSDMIAAGRSERDLLQHISEWKEVMGDLKTSEVDEKPQEVGYDTVRQRKRRQLLEELDAIFARGVENGTYHYVRNGDLNASYGVYANRNGKVYIFFRDRKDGSTLADKLFPASMVSSMYIEPMGSWAVVVSYDYAKELVQS